MISINNKLWITIVLLGGLLIVINYFESYSVGLFNKSDKIFEVPEELQKYNLSYGHLINTPGCKIPKMDKLDKNIKNFIFTPPPIICNKGIPPLFESNLTSIYIVRNTLPYYDVSNLNDLNCCYNEFWRLEPTEQDSDTEVGYSRICIKINSEVEHIDSEFIRVICNNKTNNEVYKDYFAFIPLKRKLEQKRSKNFKTNILILGLDAVSRLNLHRQLPNTYLYLTKELEAVELLGYNKVADNTFPNLMPILTGMSMSELKTVCWPSRASRFDTCPFLWRNFSRNNYITLFGEDCARINIFNLGRNGFTKQPTDYYYTAFTREMEAKIGNNGDANCDLCAGGRAGHKVTLDYLKKFVFKMGLKSMPYFGFLWSNTVSHDNVNRPSLGDLDFHEFFRSLESNGHLKNTVVIFMSDHGIRYGDMRRTYQGQLEERLPFLLIVLPKWFKQRNVVAVQNLNKNKRRLTTPFDVYETLKHLLNLNNITNISRINNRNAPSRSYSLFHEIPATRTCQDADISRNWCTCHQSFKVRTSNTDIITAARFIVDNINLQFKRTKQCATLVLHHVVDARMLHYDSDRSTAEISLKYYVVTLRTKPGGGLFEATVTFKRKEGAPKNYIKKLFSGVHTGLRIIGTISRINLHGNQSYCVNNSDLKLYCYCKSFLKL